MSDFLLTALLGICVIMGAAMFVAVAYLFWIMDPLKDDTKD